MFCSFPLFAGKKEKGFFIPFLVGAAHVWFGSRGCKLTPPFVRRNLQHKRTASLAFPRLPESEEESLLFQVTGTV